MKEFSIREVAHITGIKENTIRIWEYRYGLPSPQRNAGNLRRYTVDELEWMLDTARLTRNGHRISGVATLENDARRALLDRLEKHDERGDALADRLLLAMYRFDVAAFDSLLDTLCLLAGKEAPQTVLLPLIVRTGIAAKRALSPAGQFAAGRVRNCLIRYTEELAPAFQPKPVVLFATGRTAIDLPLYYTAYRLRREGWRVLAFDGIPDDPASLQHLCFQGCVMTPQTGRARKRLNETSGTIWQTDPGGDIQEFTEEVLKGLGCKTGANTVV